MTAPAMAGWNLGLRFGLELAALAGSAALAWQQLDGPARPVGAVLAPLAVAAVWGVFNVPGDPSRSGDAPVEVPGGVRLALELFVLFGGAAALAVAVQPVVGLMVAGLVVAHYATSVPRIEWLLAG